MKLLDTPIHHLKLPRQRKTIRLPTHFPPSPDRRTMGLFSRKDWNVLAIIFQRSDLYSVSGQRVKGGAADKARDGAKTHSRTVYWAVFNQKGSFVEGGAGPAGQRDVPPDVLKKLERELPMNRTVQEILKALETSQTDKLAKPLAWTGYPKKSPPPGE